MRVPEATAALITEVLKGQGPLHSGKAPIFRIDDDPTDRGFGHGDMHTVVKNYNEGMSVPKPVARWKLGHEAGTPLEAVLSGRTDMPGLGDFDRLSYDGKTLFGEFDKMPDAVRKAIKRGTYGSWSAEIYRDYQGQGATLDAVGLLGSKQPGKKALGAIVYNSADGHEIVRCAPVSGPITFAHLEGENQMPTQTNLGAVMMGAVQAKAANEEGMTTDSVLAEMASTAGMDTAMLVGMISGQGDTPPDDQQLMAFAQVLGMDVGILQEARDGGGTEPPTVTEDVEPSEEEEELVAMAEPTKTDDTETPEAITPEQFAELKAERDAAKAESASFQATLKSQTAQILKNTKELSDSRAAASKQDVAHFCETELAASGRVTGTNLKRVETVLNALPDAHGEQTEKFSEGENPRDAVKALILDLIPAKTRKAGTVATRTTGDGRMKDILVAFAEQKRAYPETQWAHWAEHGAQLSAEDITKGAALLPEGLK